MLRLAIDNANAALHGNAMPAEVFHASRRFSSTITVAEELSLIQAVKRAFRKWAICRTSNDQ